MTGYRHFIKIGGESRASAVIEIEVVHRGSKLTVPVQMKIDTGSASTIIPTSILEAELAVKKTPKPKICVDFNGKEVEMPRYVVDIRIQGNQFPNITILGSNPNQRYGLLGRDLLAEHFLYYDGKGQRFKIELNR